MRDFLLETAIPVFAYFIGVAFCIGIVILAEAAVTSISHDRTELAWSDQ